MGALPAAFAGAFSVFDPPLSETPSTKPQAPEKFQISDTKPTKQVPGKTPRRPVFGLELGASFELGVWDLELVTSALGFSTIEISPPFARSRFHPCAAKQRSSSIALHGFIRTRGSVATPACFTPAHSQSLPNLRRRHRGRPLRHGCFCALGVWRHRTVVHLDNECGRLHSRTVACGEMVHPLARGLSAGSLGRGRRSPKSEIRNPKCEPGSGPGNRGQHGAWNRNME